MSKTRILPVPLGGGGDLSNYYTKDQVDDKLAQQDEINELKDVDVDNLTNGQVLKWNSLTEKWENANESGGGTQVQADWTETDTSDPSYIQNKPTIPAAQVNSDWNASSGVSEILNKPSLATVATSGSYTDLSNTPSIPAAQVQSDWSQSDNTQVDYIKNKPTIPTPQVNSDWNAVSGVAQILNKPTVPQIVTLTQQQYDQLQTKDPNTQYIISDADTVTVNEADLIVNPSSSSNVPFTVLSPNNTAIGPFFAPTTGGGGNGYVLQSGGTYAAPTWVTLASLMGGLTIWTGTQAEYTALSPNYDSNTLYIIND